MDNTIIPSVFPVTCHTDFVGPGTTFVAIKGQNQDGVTFIAKALQKGASTIIVAQDALVSAEVLKQIKSAGAQLQFVNNTRKALAELSAQALGYPAKKLKILGITGTKGKTTTVFLLEHLLSTYKTALLSTVHNKILDTVLPSSLTTPQPDYLHVFFDQCVKQGVEYVVMEVAAQALSLHRVDGIQFDGVVFTNFSPTHAEFYATVEEYFSAKCLLLDQVKPDAPIIINADDAWCQKIVKHQSHWTMFGIDNKADFVAQDIQTVDVGSRCNVINGDDAFQMHIPLLGIFNVYNALSAYALLSKLAINKKSGTLIFADLKGIPGRLEKYVLSNGARCFIDYAHNPAAYKAVLSTLRALTTHLIVVCGSGGDRDAIMRPVMGGIVSEIADVIIFTSDDPRSEDPQNIVDDMMAGVHKAYKKKVIIELDRQKAICKAAEISQSDSVIAVLGKGHAQYQLIKGVKHHFSEREIIQSL